MKIHCIIVEDEPLAMEKLAGYVMKSPELILDAKFESGAEALSYLRTHAPDLTFLDINLGEISGIGMLESASVPGKVILTTAYHEYAVEAYNMDVVDYLLKPFTFERFSQAISKAIPLIEKPALRNDFIFVKSEHKLEKILFSELLFIEGMRDYRRIHTTSRRIMTLQTFTELEDMIPVHVACRVHKSYMVSLSKIDSIERNSVLIGTHRIPISETYKNGFYDLIK